MTGVSTNTAHGRVVAAAATRAASALLDLDFALVDPTGKNTQCGKAFERLLFRPVCFGVLVGGGIAYPSETTFSEGPQCSAAVFLASGQRWHHPVTARTIVRAWVFR